MGQRTLDGRDVETNQLPEHLQKEDEELEPEARVLKRYATNYEPLTGGN